MDDGKTVQKSGSLIWQNNWKSPISLGLFILTAGAGLAVLIFTFLNFWITAQELKASSSAESSGMSAQEMQQLESQGAATAPATGAAAQ
jgi:hypothetical protein